MISLTLAPQHRSYSSRSTTEVQLALALWFPRSCDMQADKWTADSDFSIPIGPRSHTDHPII